MNTRTDALLFRPREREAGAALIVIVALVMTMGFLAGVMMVTVKSTGDHVAFKSENERLAAAGVAAVDFAMHDVWSTYLASRGGDPGSVVDFKQHLDAMGVSDGQAAMGAGSGGGPGGLSSLLNLSGDNTAGSDLLGTVGLSRDHEGNPVMSGARVHSLAMRREDNAFGTVLRFSTTVSFADDDGRHRTKEVEQLYYAEGQPFNGFGFALLSDNVNCLLCHTEIDSAQRYYNGDAAAYGTFPRSKIGVLESLHFRGAEADSNLSGTLYTRGSITNGDGSPISSWNGLSFTSRTFDASGMLAQNSSGGLLSTPFSPASGDPLPANANLYIGYPEDESLQSDGKLPDVIPPVFPDNNQNRRVDASEFAAVAAEARGSLIGGGKISVNAGSTYNRPQMPQQDQVGDITGVHSGNLVLYGTNGHPLQIDGRVVVDGDVVIAGLISGEGEIVARGNIYIVGPLAYDDAKADGNVRVYGTGEDGSTNRLGLAAGGNVLIGNFLKTQNGSTATTSTSTGTTSGSGSNSGGGNGNSGGGGGNSGGGGGNSGGGGGNTLNSTLNGATSTLTNSLGGQEYLITGSANGGYNFTMAEMMLFNRGEWSKTQLTLPGPGGLPVVNPGFQPGYVPRYYSLYNNGPVYVFAGGDTHFDPSTGTWVGKEYATDWTDAGWTQITAAQIAASSGVVLPLMPAGGWMTASQIDSFANQQAASWAESAFEVDALIYTNNSAFFFVERDSVYKGIALLNGSLIAADAGVLAPGRPQGGEGLRLNYDNRQSEGLRVRNSSQLTLRKGFQIR